MLAVTDIIFSSSATAVFNPIDTINVVTPKPSTQPIDLKVRS